MYLPFHLYNYRCHSEPNRDINHKANHKYDNSPPTKPLSGTTNGAMKLSLNVARLIGKKNSVRRVQKGGVSCFRGEVSFFGEFAAVNGLTLWEDFMLKETALSTPKIALSIGRIASNRSPGGILLAREANFHF